MTGKPRYHAGLPRRIVPAATQVTTMETPKIRVLIADDQPVLSSGLQLLLDAEPDLSVVGVTASAADAIERLATGGVDVVLFDLAMPGAGVSGLRTLLAASPRAKVVVLTFMANRPYIETAIRLGALGYLTKRAPLDELIAAIRAAMAGKVFVERALGYQAPARLGPAPSDRLEALSPRELQVLGQIARGHTNREIAERLDVSVKTIEGYRARILHKLGVRTRADLVAYAMLAGLLPMGPAAVLDED